MKRSEMEQLLVNKLNTIAYFRRSEELSKGFAKQLLYLIEEKGMLPPATYQPGSIIDLKWEEE